MEAAHMFLRKYFIIIFMIFIVGLSTACSKASYNNNNDTKKSVSKNTSSSTVRLDESIPDNWHKAETDKFNISYPSEWMTSYNNGYLSFYNKNVEIGTVSVQNIIPQSPNTVYLHGQYIVTWEEKISGFFTTEAYLYKFYTEPGLSATDTTISKFEDLLLFPNNDRSIVYVIDFHTEDVHDKAITKYVDENTILQVAKTLIPKE